MDSGPYPKGTPLAPTRTRNRTRTACPTIWSQEEDALLLKVGLRTQDWSEIAKYFPGKTQKQIITHWEKVVNPDLKRGSWTQEEDQRIYQWVSQNGPGRWAFLADQMPGRIAKQCRERWCNHLDPSIKTTCWTPDEDNLIIRLISKIGTKWAVIAKHLPGRTDNAVKNRWNSTLKRHLNNETSTPIPTMHVPSVQIPKPPTEANLISTAPQSLPLLPSVFPTKFNQDNILPTLAAPGVVPPTLPLTKFEPTAFDGHMGFDKQFQGQNEKVLLSSASQQNFIKPNHNSSSNINHSIIPHVNPHIPQISSQYNINQKKLLSGSNPYLEPLQSSPSPNRSNKIFDEKPQGSLAVERQKLQDLLSKPSVVIPPFSKGQ